MLLHENEDLFNGLVIQTAAFKNIPQDDVLNVMGKLDMLLKRLANKI